MATQTIAIGAPFGGPFPTWVNFRGPSSVFLDAAFTVGGSTAVRIESVSFYNSGSLAFNLYGGTDALLPSLIAKAHVFIFQVAGLPDLIVAGPNHSSNSLRTTAEPYSWRPSNSAEVIAFFNGLTSSSHLTVSISDNNAFPIPLDIKDIDGSAEVPAPLRLDDLAPTDVVFDLKAVIEVNGGDSGTLYGTWLYHHDSDQGGTDTPLAGELGLGAGQTVISGLRWSGLNNRLLLEDDNDPVSLDLEDFFSAGGAAHDWTLYFKTASAETSFRVSDRLTTNPSWLNSNAVAFEGPNASFFNGLTAGERLIIGLGFPATVLDIQDVDGSAQASGTIEAIEVLSDMDIQDIDGSAQASGTLDTIEVFPPLMLSELAPTDIVFDLKALILVNGGEGGLGGSHAGDLGILLYEDSHRGGTDTPVDGEIGLGPNQTLISRIRWFPTQGDLLINDNDHPLNLNLGTFFSVGGAAHGWTWYFKTATDEVSFLASSTLVTNSWALGGNWVNFKLPVGHAGIAFFNGLTAGERLIIGLGFPGTALDVKDADGSAAAQGAVQDIEVVADLDVQNIDGSAIIRGTVGGSGLSGQVGGQGGGGQIEVATDLDIQEVDGSATAQGTVESIEVITDLDILDINGSAAIRGTLGSGLSGQGVEVFESPFDPIAMVAPNFRCLVDIKISDTVTLRVSDQEGQDQYREYLQEPVRIIDELPDLFFSGVAPEQSASLTLLGSFRDILQKNSVTDLRGLNVTVRIVKGTDTANPVRVHAGQIAEVTESAESISITSHTRDYDKMADLIPKMNIADLFPDAPLDDVEGDNAPAVIIPFRSMRKVGLVPLERDRTTGVFRYGVVLKDILALDDLAPPDVDFDMKAMILVNGAPDPRGYTNIYADADRGGTDTPLAGDLDLDAVIRISRIFWNEDNRDFAINRNRGDFTLLSAFFGPGGQAHGWTWYFKTKSGEISFPVSSTTAALGGGFARFRLPVGHAGVAFFNGLTAGERLIVGLGHPRPPA